MTALAFGPNAARTVAASVAWAVAHGWPVVAEPFVLPLTPACPANVVTAPDTPVPFSPPLEQAFIPQTEDVVAGLRELAAY